MFKDSNSFDIIGLGGFGESGANYFFENLSNTAKCLVFNDGNNLYTSNEIMKITIENFTRSEYYEKLISALIENIMLASHDKEVFVLAGGGGALNQEFAEFLISVLSMHNFKIVVLISSPFQWEGKQREKRTEELIVKIKPFVQAVFKYDNEKMKQSVSRDKPAFEAYRLVFEEYEKLINMFNLFQTTKPEIQNFLHNEKMILELA